MVCFSPPFERIFSQHSFIAGMKRIAWPLVIFLLFIAFCREKKADSISQSSSDPVLRRLFDDARNFPDSTLLVDRIIDSLAARDSFKAGANWCDTLLRRNREAHFVYQLVKADMLRSGKYYADAIASYREYLTTRPEDPTVFLAMANTMAEASHKETIATTDSIGKAFPTPEVHTGICYIKGIYHSNLGQFAEARRWMDSVIRCDYAFADAYLEKGYTWYDEGRYAEAAATFKKLTDIHTRNADGWYWLGKSLEAMQQKTEAIKAYERCLLLDATIKEANEAIERLQ